MAPPDLKDASVDLLTIKEVRRDDMGQISSFLFARVCRVCELCARRMNFLLYKTCDFLVPPMLSGG